MGAETLQRREERERVREHADDKRTTPVEILVFARSTLYVLWFHVPSCEYASRKYGNHAGQFQNLGQNERDVHCVRIV